MDSRDSLDDGCKDSTQNSLVVSSKADTAPFVLGVGTASHEWGT